MARKSRGRITIEIPDDVLVVHAQDSAAWRRLDKAEGWFVYSMYEANRRIVPPLYVGVTGHLYQRLSAHRRQQAWWPIVGDIVIEHFTDRSDAYDAEDRRIYVLQPLFNTVCNIHTPRSEATA
ncbi:hypothetical protein [Mycobacterium sp. NPDC050853]|uniref:hypothetical protein n=1 Tax=Mycobacterium sp. NPDC050853 TaxID=3155160 RepID=UPI0033E5D762